MLSSPEQTLLREAQSLSGDEDDYHSLLDLVGDASIVLLGEASHGTHEFYRERAHIPGQFDAVVHIDETRAVEPLERTAGWEAGEAPETYPSGL